YAFILLTAAVVGFSQARLTGTCAAWFVVASLFEVAQHPAIAPIIAAEVPAWFTRVPILDNTAAYFLNGTFDPLDLLSIALGTIAACVTILLTRNSANTPSSNKLPHSLIRYFSLGGITFFGMLAIIGSGDGTTGSGSTSTGTLSGPSAVFVDVVNDRLYVANTTGNSVLVYDNASILNGSIPPDRTLLGNLTTLSAPSGIYVDTTRNLLYVANGTNQILVFSNAAAINGNVSPVRTIDGLSSPVGIFINVMADRLYIANTGADSVLVFDNASTATSISLPDRVLSGGSSALIQPRDVFVDTGTDRLYVTNAGDNSVLVFNNASTVDNPTPPDRTLNLSASTGPWGIYVDDTPIVIGSTASLDGYARSDGTASASGSPATGDKEASYSLGVGWRQLYSFDIANIPTSTTIASATLRLYQCDVRGFPYTNLGNVIVDQMNYGGVFDPFGSAYNLGTVALNIGTLSTTPIPGYRSLSAATQVQNDLTALRVRSQYRLRFSTQDYNFDAVDDFVQFTDAEDSPCAGLTTEQPPQLVITLGNSSELYISGNANSTLLSYDNANTASGTDLPNRVVAGGLTTLNAPRGIAADMARNQLYVANFANNSILVFDNARTVTGGNAPSRTITP
ncbi:MAG TPA: hypothetical protein VLB06_03785, partial [Sulfuricaulis sp.]|nr:hypothetical protein [Sulfuricaulis sp.]